MISYHAVVMRDKFGYTVWLDFISTIKNKKRNAMFARKTFCIQVKRICFGWPYLVRANTPNGCTKRRLVYDFIVF